jgi:hypothetical protein
MGFWGLLKRWPGMRIAKTALMGFTQTKCQSFACCDAGRAVLGTSRLGTDAAPDDGKTNNAPHGRMRLPANEERASHRRESGIHPSASARKRLCDINAYPLNKR